MATTTEGAIAERLRDILRELAPAQSVDVPFRPFPEELAGNFRRYARENPSGMTRMFQVRELETTPPLVSNGDVVLVQVTYEIVVAYAQDHRFGPDAAAARRAAIKADEHRIVNAIGMHARASFTPPTYPDACWVSGEAEREDDEGCDFLVITQTMQFYRAVT